MMSVRANPLTPYVAWLDCLGRMVVLEPSTGKKGTAKTGAFPLPKPVEELVRQGVELGEADDR
jgi:non-canonical (house-cleaning) NTP pyrophosphatase